MKRVKLGNQSMLYPYPVTIVTTVIEGKKNFMQVGFSGIVNANPGMVSLGISKTHFTTNGLEEGNVIGLSLADESMLIKADYVGLRSGHKVDKSDVFKTFTGDYGAELIEEAPINLELEIIKVLDLGGVDNIIISEIKEVHAKETVMTGKFPDIEKINPLVFSMYENKYFRIGDQVGSGWRDGLKYEHLKSFVLEIFKGFDVLADIDTYLKHVSDSSKFDFAGQVFEGIEGFKTWYQGVNKQLLKEGIQHHVTNFDVKKLGELYQVDFDVRFIASTKNGQKIDDLIHERWLVRDDETFIIEDYKTELV
ncbi:flavin reductase family protein [Acidaminobacter sp. JC074]|uniref:flavin reductase family protein n=1 Tax=Acidaminobacter sp. JC074 TaxID=2530199 RepID=UPI001F117B32|nr:flavin reductase family protein [Acidaminobacter sp. JC074]MCH4886902.1 flavin reductase family protein [Acidaminobacter sp. JC074]